jgi:Raf kinase inhibitor-like YbhB/YbcL family protein
MRLTSTDFSDDGRIPRVCSCDGEDASPALAWTDPPPATKSFVLLCNDPDAPDGVWRHWAAYDIPHGWSRLARGAGKATAREHPKHAINDFGRPGYAGPCPPQGHGSHHYRFILLALSVDKLNVHADPQCRDVEREARRHVIAETTLVGLYER